MTPEEKIVFNLIVEQRNRSDSADDYFIYSVDQGQKKLQSMGEAVAHGIGRSEHIEIIRELAKDGIIDADWYTKCENPDGVVPDFELAHHDEDWLWDKYDILAIPSAPEKAFFIQLSFKHIKFITDNYIAEHLCTLSYNTNKCYFELKCDNGETHVIGKLKSGGLPFEVLRIALENPCTAITRDELRKQYSQRAPIGKKSIATQVFDHNSVVRNTLAPFVHLTNDSIRVNPNVKLTLAELQNIEEISL